MRPPSMDRVPVSDRTLSPPMWQPPTVCVLQSIASVVGTGAPPWVLTSVESRWRAVVLLGPPGSGKGTLGSALGSLPGFFHYSSGDTLRDLDSQTELGQKVQVYTDTGELVPSQLVIEVCKQSMNDAMERGDFDPAVDVVIFDGMPRDVDQARELEVHARVGRVFHLTCQDNHLLTQRIRHRRDRRPDDLDSSVIEHRFQVYRTQTLPVLNHYPATLIAHVDAAQPPLSMLHQMTRILLSTGT